MDVALKGEEWRKPGLVALAAKLATSARERRPIKVRVPASYEPKTGANPWAEAGGDACTGPGAVPEPINNAVEDARTSLGAAAAMVAPPPKPAPQSRSSDEVELVSMPPARTIPPPPGLAPAASPPAVAQSNPVADFVSHRRKGLFPPTTQSHAQPTSLEA
jgi:hypothetical protein